MEQSASKFVAYLKKNLILIVVLLFILIIALFYSIGYRISPGLSISRVGTLKFLNVPNGTSLYTDQLFRKTTNATSTVSLDLVKGNHRIIVSYPGDYPWSTTAPILSGKTTTIDPIFIPLQPAATLLTGTGRDSALAAVASSTLPSETNPLTFANGCVHVYVTNNQVLATSVIKPGCIPPPYICIQGKCAPTIVFAPIAPLTAVLKFPGHDALVVEFNKTLYGIALDPRAPQFFAPILTGTNPVAGHLSDGTIVVQNNNVVYKLAL